MPESTNIHNSNEENQPIEEIQAIQAIQANHQFAADELYYAYYEYILNIPPQTPVFVKYMNMIEKEMVE